MSFVVGVVVGFVAGWFLKHFYGAKAQAALDTEVAKVKSKV